MKCSYCGRELCGSLSGSTLCEPDMYRSRFGKVEVDIFVSQWGMKNENFQKNEDESYRFDPRTVAEQHIPCCSCDGTGSRDVPGHCESCMGLGYTVK